MSPRFRALPPRSGILAAGLVALAPGARAEDPFTAYLFAYFTGNDKSQYEEPAVVRQRDTCEIDRKPA